MTSLLNSIKQVLNEEKQNLEEKSVSQSQQKLMGMAYALKKGEMEEKDASDEVKKLAASMTLKDLKDFASTKHDEIPAKKEEVELDEAIKSKNQYGGYRNEVGSDAEYAKTHAMLKKLLRKDDTTIRDYMDSTSGRHLAGLEGDTAYIKKDFKKFMKKYDPSFFKEGVEVDARRKSFREALKRIEGYKSKRSSMKTEGSKEEYEKFFKGAMKKFGITDLGDLEGKKEKEFYDYVDANWKAKDESVIEKVRKIVNEKRKQRAMAMNEVDEPSSQNDKDLVNFHKRNTQVKSDI